MLHREGSLQRFFSQQLAYERCKTIVIAVCYIHYNILLFHCQEVTIQEGHAVAGAWQNLLQ